MKLTIIVFAVVYTGCAMEPNPMRALIRAVNFAAIKHKNQRRKDPENTPYINHPIGEKEDVCLAEYLSTTDVLKQNTFSEDSLYG